jgi:endonuclease G
MDVQLSDEYYSKSGFDRGHMSRREDAKWGDTPEDAERNANLTCMYTNACPQVPTINRPENPGLWGKLEQVVLEKGIEREVGRTAMASVFNGPIFQDSDPVFKGIQVPMDFYKIVIWVTDAGGLKATAFRLTQVQLVADIDFEEIDIDKNTQFKPYQVSIQSLQDATSIDFSAILPLDTFEGDGQELTEESVSAHIAKHNRA